MEIRDLQAHSFIHTYIHTAAAPINQSINQSIHTSIRSYPFSNTRTRGWDAPAIIHSQPPKKLKSQPEALLKSPPPRPHSRWKYNASIVRPQWHLSMDIRWLNGCKPWFGLAWCDYLTWASVCVDSKLAEMVRWCAREATREAIREATWRTTTILGYGLWWGYIARRPFRACVCVCMYVCFMSEHVPVTLALV